MPPNERLEAVQYCMLLLDEENRDTLQCLLYLLYDITQNCEVHKVKTFFYLNTILSFFAKKFKHFLLTNKDGRSKHFHMFSANIDQHE